MMNGIAMMTRLLTITLLMASFMASHAEDVPPDFSDPESRSRYYDMIEEIRCLVCQNQNLADSNAELAQDLRNVIREKIEAGQTDKEIVQFLTDRYGDFVLYRPPLRDNTLVLWAGPFVILLLALFLLIRTISKRNAANADARPLTEETRKRIEAILRDDDGGENS
jgi:cytochrome c-type biogenesis protein CcmH